MFLSQTTKLYGGIIVSAIFMLVSICLFVFLLIDFFKNNLSKKKVWVSLIILIITLVIVNLFIIINYLVKKSSDPSLAFPAARVLIYSAFVIILFNVFGYFVLFKKQKQQEKIPVVMVATLGLLVALASVLMYLGIPIFPAYPYLKVEISALIYFIVFLWYGIKPSIAVLFLANIIHIILPPLTPPIVPGLDQLSNVVACLMFLLPAYIAFKRLPKNEMPRHSFVILTSILGTLLTTVFMVFYNYYFNLPVIFNWPWEFKEALTVFGSFNLIKWGVVGLSIVLLYRKLYDLKSQIIVEK